MLGMGRGRKISMLWKFSLNIAYIFNSLEFFEISSLSFDTVIKVSEETL